MPCPKDAPRDAPRDASRDTHRSTRRLSPVAARARRAAQLFAGDRRGATAIEFGLVAVPLLGLIAMTSNVGLAYLIDRNLDAAVQEASRMVRTGAVQGAGIQNASDFVNNYVCPKSGAMLGSMVNCSKLIVDVRTTASFTGNDLSNSFYKTQASNQFCLGAPSTITIIRIAYPMPWFLPVVSYGPFGAVANHAGLVNDVPNGNGQWVMLRTAVAVLRTEPYPQGQYTKKVGC